MDKEKNYLTISPQEISSQNEIFGIQSFIISEEKTYVKTSLFKYQNSQFNFRYPHVCEGIGFIICTKGKAKIRINLEEYLLEENSTITILPNYILQMVELDESLEIEFIMFSFDLISDIRVVARPEVLEQLQKSKYMKLNADVILDLLDFHTFILNQYRKTNYDQNIIKNLLSALIHKVLLLHKEFSRIDNKEALSHKEQMFQRFIELLNIHYRSERSVQFYADKLCVTPSHLSKIIKETSHKPISSWIDEIVIMTAKALLKSSDMTATQIAEELHFANSSFFGTYFRKRTGITPLQYRER